ncbi:uncharacterized protein LOC119606605 [Lucilia sericata]|uniref:uncharacterized protein LOC119606605 n=1 Tax=Lucilia sericata TaxID=13632 RepID=UPI0018A81E45|nr:uncharacterized protein LOC119606605 [Lucilia sericata]
MATPTSIPIQTATPTATPTNDQTETLEETSAGNTLFIELDNLIDGLIKFMKPKNNIHHSIKNQAWAIKATYNKVRKEMTLNGTLQASETKELSTQTTPKTEHMKDLKRSRESGDISSKTPIPKKSKITNQTQKKSEVMETIVNGKPKTNDDINSWRTVPRKKIVKKRKEKEAMIISAKGKATYADILKHIKSDPNLKDLGEYVSRIRRTLKGDLLLEINPANKQSVDQFQAKVEKSVGQQANIRTSRQMTVIECKDIDEITTKSDICEAFNNHLGISIKESDITSLRKSYSGTQTASVRLPVEMGRKAIEIGKVKIGWVICRIREKRLLTKCFRCL